MTTIPSLPNQNLPPSLDARLLHEVARRRIEALVSDVWTDYNTHDPGITMLEILAYAVTDLGLRVRLPTADYLGGGEAHHFFTAREVLPPSAWNYQDFRRLLIDRPEIRNAWVEVKRDRIKGLNRLLLDLTPVEFTDQEGNIKRIDLSEIWLQGDPITVGEATYDFYLVFPHMESLPEVWSSDNELTAVTIDNVVRAEDPEKTVFDDYFIDFAFSFENATETVNSTLRVRLSFGIPKENDDSEFQTALEEQLSEVAFFRPHQFRARQRLQGIGAVRQFILPRRNLCEDWAEIGTIRIHQIGLRIKALELGPEADPEAVVARIYFLIEQFLDPAIRPRRFDELLAEGKTAAEIFDGPLLERGFIPRGALNPVERENRIYTSDLVRIIMREAKVIGVNGLTLDHFLDRIKAASGVVNCLNLSFRDPATYKVKFSFEDSEVNVIRRDLVIDLDRERIRTIFEQLRSELLDSFPSDGSGDLPIPPGDQLDLQTFHSIQNDFPQVYGLRAGEIVETAPPLRRAQARQMKAFLLFAEQLMANYAAQLANLPELFSMRTEVERTYFYQALYDVPAVRELFTDFLAAQLEAEPVSWEAFQGLCNRYIKTLNFCDEDQPAFRTRRYRFIEHLLARFGEGFGDYADWVIGRNRGQITSDLLLDQLDLLRRIPELGRERGRAFNYVAILPDGETADVWDTENVSGMEKRVAHLLGISDYRRRDLAGVFQIFKHVEMFDERDMDEETKEYRFRFWNAPVTEVYEGIDPGDVASVDNDRFKILLSSTRHYPMNEGFPEEVINIVHKGREGPYYHVIQTEPARVPECKYFITLLGADLNTEDPIARNIHWTFISNRAEVEQEIREIIHLMQGRHTEGMHVVEHTLLRPRPGTKKCLQIPAFIKPPKPDEEMSSTVDPVTCIEQQPGTGQFIVDPYSFQISVFLPGWTPRFADREFRAIAERRLREEIPAHIFAWIYWVNPVASPEPGEHPLTGLDTPFTGLEAPSEFVAFEESYKHWLEVLNATSRSEGTIDALATAQDDFVEKFNALVKIPQVELTNRRAYQIFELDN